jgi:hypothetical protein
MNGGTACLGYDDVEGAHVADERSWQIAGVGVVAQREGLVQNDPAGGHLRREALLEEAEGSRIGLDDVHDPSGAVRLCGIKAERDQPAEACMHVPGVSCVRHMFGEKERACLVRRRGT